MLLRSQLHTVCVTCFLNIRTSIKEKCKSKITAFAWHLQALKEKQPTLVQRPASFQQCSRPPAGSEQPISCVLHKTMFISLCWYVNFHPSPFPPSSSTRYMKCQGLAWHEINAIHSLFQMSHLTCCRHSITIPARPIQSRALQTVPGVSWREWKGNGWNFICLWVWVVFPTVSPLLKKFVKYK